MYNKDIIVLDGRKYEIFQYNEKFSCAATMSRSLRIRQLT